MLRFLQNLFLIFCLYCAAFSLYHMAFDKRQYRHVYGASRVLIEADGNTHVFEGDFRVELYGNFK